MMVRPMKFQRVGDRCPSRHLLEIGCHAKFGVTNIIGETGAK